MNASDLDQLTGDALIKGLFKTVASKDDITSINTVMEGIKTEVEGIKTEMEDIKTEVEGIKTEMEEKIKGIDIKMEKVISETKARHYDMQNIALQNNGISLSGHVSSAQAAGRSPRITLNSHDTLH